MAIIIVIVVVIMIGMVYLAVRQIEAIWRRDRGAAAIVDE